MIKERENFPFFLQRNNRAKQLAKFACFHSPGEKNQRIGLTNELLKNSQFKTKSVLFYVGSVPRTDRLGNGPYIYNVRVPALFCYTFSILPI